jgi:hypothetical protein
MTEHKIGTVYVPKDKSQYGFSGPGADAAAVDINASIKMTIRAIQAHDAKQWEASYGFNETLQGRQRSI